ncbi:MAG: chloride channel protein [Acidiferrobacterales bacterium]|nr:chloride channel protein [Acidiferrobacterales bacterium]
MTISKLIHFVSRGYDRFREAQQVRMSSNFEGLPLLSILGLVCGLVSGGVILLFRLVMESGADLIIPNGNIEGFEGLSSPLRFCLCVAGGLLVGLLLQSFKSKSRTVGVVHVLERLDYHQGYLPIKNAILQFIAATISLLSGHSVGREGPSVHLGAAGGSILGRILQVPNNSVRILVGCGVAAAISAAFNTPLAGVIFAMEVVIMEYTVIGFTPVIIAAVSATTLTRILLGDESAISAPIYDLNYIFEIPLVALMGAMVGCLSAAFIQITMFTSSLFLNKAIWVRTLLAGVITGLVAILLPQIMGTGYDTVNHVLLTQIGITGVILLTIAKLITTSTAIGLGIPAGLIGPTIFIGAAAGSAFGLLAADFAPGIAGAGFYAMLGMAAMMAATLQAPLAALIYLLELTSNQAVILPGMTAVIVASLVTRVVFGKSSIYRHLMLAKGLDYRNTPMSKALRRIGVASVMHRDFMQVNRQISKANAESILKKEPRWIFFNDIEKKNAYLLPATDLARHINELDTDKQVDPDLELDLLRIPAKRLDSVAIRIIDTLQEAHETMQANDCQILYVTGAHGSAKNRIYGIITRTHIDSSYQF